MYFPSITHAHQGVHTLLLFDCQDNSLMKHAHADTNSGMHLLICQLCKLVSSDEPWLVVCSLSFLQVTNTDIMHACTSKH